MEEQSFYSQLEKIYKTNGGYITRQDVDKAGISSWFLSDYVKRNNLNKIAPGFYADDKYVIDDYYILQRRYPKYIYTGMSALFLHHLIDKIPTNIEVIAPHGYNPSRYEINNLVVRKISNKDIYNLGIMEIKTMYGNVVKVYDKERTICDLVKYRNRYDSETFIKAIKIYAKTSNQVLLFKYARMLGIEKKMFEIMELIINTRRCLVS